MLSFKRSFGKGFGASMSNLELTISIPLKGEVAERFNEFVTICNNQGIDPDKRIANLILGDILMYEKVCQT